MSEGEAPSGWGPMGREGGVPWGVTSGAVIVAVSAMAGVLEGGGENIAIR